MRQVGCALTQFIQQARILDGDDGLGGEVLYQRDLLVGKRDELPGGKTVNAPMSSFSFSIGTVRYVRTPPSSTAVTTPGLFQYRPALLRHRRREPLSWLLPYDRHQFSDRPVMR